MIRKMLIACYTGDSRRLIHALLNALDMKACGNDTKLIIEGDATKTFIEMAQEGALYNDLYHRVMDADLVESVCMSCASHTGVLEKANELGLRVSAKLEGHPALSTYAMQGYDVVLF